MALGCHCTFESTSSGKPSAEKQRGDYTGGSGEPLPINSHLGTGMGLGAGPVANEVAGAGTRPS